MPRITESSIQDVAAANDIVEVIGGYLALKRAGSAFKALCPFHREKTPSFTVNPSRQSFHCFGCGAGGGVIRFVMDYEHLPFAEAVRKLADRAGVRLVLEEGTGEPDAGDGGERPRLLAMHREAAAWFSRMLLREGCGEPARDYLRARGLNREVAVRWGLGYAPDSKSDGAAQGGLCAHLQNLGYKPAELVASGLAGRSESSNRLYDRFRGRMMIPIHNDYGEVIAFSGRILDPEASPAKYVNSPETPIFTKGRVLFGLHRTKRSLIESGSAIVCEGQIDLISLYEAGVTNVTAPQGTAFTTHQAMLLKRFVGEVVLCFDSDAAGRKAAARSLPALLEKELRVRMLELPPGEDPDSLVRREGGDAFRERVAAAPDFLTARIATARESGQLESGEGVSAVARELAGWFAQIPDDVLRDRMINSAAAGLKISPASFHNLVRKSKKFESDPAPEDEGPQTRPPVALSPGCELLCRLALFFPEVRAWLASRSEFSPRALGPDFELLEKIIVLPPESAPGAIAGFLATLPAEFQSAASRLDDKHPPRNPLSVAAQTWSGLFKKFYADQIERTKTQLLAKNLQSSEILAVQKELLDLQKKLLEVSTPFFADQTA